MKYIKLIGKSGEKVTATAVDAKELLQSGYYKLDEGEIVPENTKHKKNEIAGMQAKSDNKQEVKETRKILGRFGKTGSKETPEEVPPVEFDDEEGEE